MPNYKESQVSGTSYLRCRQVVVDNQLNRTPSVTFTEERITTIGTETLKDQITAPIAVNYDPDVQIAILDPETLLPTETTVSMAFLNLAIYSAYMHYANIRDTPVPVVPEPEPEVVLEPLQLSKLFQKRPSM